MFLYVIKEKIRILIEKIRLGIFGKVNYIGGTDTLPPPLSKEELEEIFERIEKSNDKSAKEKLIVHNLRLVV